MLGIAAAQTAPSAATRAMADFDSGSQSNGYDFSTAAFWQLRLDELHPEMSQINSTPASF
jgi:hypothetical protein